jgi:RNA polymerase sigma-70 factor, ECF subfamily
VEDFEQLFRDHFNRLCNKVYRLTHNKEAARDIVQEVFLSLWSKRQLLENAHSRKAYLYQSVIYHTLNYLKKDRRIVFFEEWHENGVKDYSPEDIYRHKELQEQVERAIGLLPAGCRQVFILHRFQEMSYREIADHLSLSINSVEKHMGRALRLLRQYVQLIIAAFLFQ